jgi:SAM-dependent methyltransferase
MPRTQPFDEYHVDYEDWFEHHAKVYLSELEALRSLIPRGKSGVEIGVGSGRFALPLGIVVGIDPSREMRKLAAHRGVDVRDAVAEALPFRDGTFDFALMVTTICFVDDVRKSFEEIHRILKEDGCVVVGMVDKESSLGRTYLRMKSENKFYRVATFYSTSEAIGLLEELGFADIKVVQTVFGNLDEIKEVQSYREGFGEGGFVAIKATKNRVHWR